MSTTGHRRRLWGRSRPPMGPLVPIPVSRNECGRSCSRPGPYVCLRVLTVRAMLRDGMDPAAVTAVTGVPRVLVDVILAEDLNRH
jgi:hypothetical protein